MPPQPKVFNNFITTDTPSSATGCIVSDFIATANSMGDPNQYTNLAASHHFTPNLNMLDFVIPFTSDDRVMVGDGKIIFISHVAIQIYLQPCLKISLVFLLCVMIIKFMLNFILHFSLLRIKSHTKSSFRVSSPSLFFASSSTSPSSPFQVHVVVAFDPNLQYKHLDRSSSEVVYQSLKSCNAFANKSTSLDFVIRVSWVRAINVHLLYQMLKHQTNSNLFILTRGVLYLFHMLLVINILY